MSITLREMLVQSRVAVLLYDCLPLLHTWNYLLRSQDSATQTLSRFFSQGLHEDKHANSYGQLSLQPTQPANWGAEEGKVSSECFCGPGV